LTGARAEWRFGRISPDQLLFQTQVLPAVSDFKVVNRTVPSLLSLIPGSLLLAVILLVQKLLALLAS